MKLTDKQLRILKKIRYGADIYSRPLTIECRKLAGKGLIEITEAQNTPAGGAERQPYFGIILTTKGRKLLAKKRGGK